MRVYVHIHPSGIQLTQHKQRATCLEVLYALVAVHHEAERGELARPVGDGPLVAHAVEPVLELERLEAGFLCLMVGMGCDG